MRRVGDVLAGLEALPEVGIADVLKSRRALILAPHPDDESLGCGGLIAAACAAGLAPVIVILTDGAASHPGSVEYPPARLRNLREQEAARAVGALGLAVGRLRFMRYEDAALPSSGAAFDAAVARIVSIGRDFGCDMLIGPWHGDPHCDHEAGACIAAAVAEQTGWNLLSYPVWGWLRDKQDFVEESRQGGWRLNISPHLAAKQNAIAAHESQYGGMIKDSPGGFKLPKNLLVIFARPFEIFLA